MFEGVSKKLMIVGDAKTNVYCEFLSMLVSAKDDKKNQEDGQVQEIGNKDGSLSASVWSDKTYRDNLAQTASAASNNLFVFIGETDASKNILQNITARYHNDYGIQIGWLGSKAAITVDYNVLKDELKGKYLRFYEEYTQLCKQYDAHMLEDKKAANQADSLTGKIKRKFDSVGATDDSKTKKILKKGGIVLGAGTVAAFAPIIPLAGVALAAFIVNSEKKKKVITEQMYRYAVLKFYLDHLKEFIKDNTLS